MKKTNHLFFVLCISILLFSSCSGTKEYVSNVVVNKAITNPKAQTIVITATDSLRLNNFTETYKKKYKNNNDFAVSYSTEFSSEVKNNAVFSEIKLTTINQWDSLKENSTADYIIHLSDFEITNRIENRDYSSSSSYDHTVSIEYCVVNVKVIVYDVKNEKEILEFVSTGESSISFFNYAKSLEKSKSRSIIHIVNYLKSGKTNYKRY